MNDIFCIISAIGVNYGVFDYQQRYAQLVETVNSIRKYKPDASICLVEVSESQLPEADAELLKNHVDHYLPLHSHRFVHEILIHLDNHDSNRAARKTVGELIGYIEFLLWLKNQNKQYNRVFKISGRLKLNDNFTKIDYSTLNNKVVTSKKWWYDRYAYIIQLWSFDYTMLDKMIEVFLDMWKYEMEILTTKHMVDIVETTLYRYLNNYNVPVHEVEGHLGVEGYFGQDGNTVYV